MNHLNDLEKLEKQLYLSYSQDGLADLLIGLWLSLAGLLMLVGQPAFIGLSGIPILFYLPLKRRLIITRMGSVIFSKERKKRLSNLAIFLLISGILVFMFLVIRFSIGPFRLVLDQHVNVIFGILIALLVFTAGMFTGIKRFYLYAVVALIVFSVEEYIVNSLPAVLLSFGILLTLVGVVVLLLFLVKNPIVHDELIHEEEVTND